MRAGVRVIDANRSSDTKEYLERLQKAWSKISPTPLVLPSEEQFEPADAKKSPGSEAPNKESEKPKLPRDPKLNAKDVTMTDSASEIGVPSGYLSGVFQVATDDEKGNAEKTKPTNSKNFGEPNANDKSTVATEQKFASAIQISFDERGNLVLTGDDPEL